MTTLILSHPACLGHDPGPGHPEAVSRLKTVFAAIQGLDGAGLAFAEAPEADIEALASAHDVSMIEKVFMAIPDAGYGALDHETLVSPGSRAAVLRAAGAAMAAVDAVASGAMFNAFCAVRPPGHHATRDRSMGFCLFNNAALAAVRAQEEHHFERVAVVDFDVHHGNGTEDILRGRDGFFYGSSHEYPNYPGTGRHSEDGPCRIVNVPLAPMTSGARFRDAWRHRILPELFRFRPDFMIVSAGFDGHRKDPLSMMQLEVADFAWLTAALRRIAEDCCGGRLVSVLEGGYDLDALAASARAHVVALASPCDSSDPEDFGA
ncbi:MAG: histone deacetylase family protein [Alphaproteobacteria bacterium]